MKVFKRLRGWTLRHSWVKWVFSGVGVSLVAAQRHGAQLSPDGNWIAYALDDDKLHLAAYGGAEERTFEFKEGKPHSWYLAGWGRDGNAVYLGTSSRDPQGRIFWLDLRSGKSQLWKSIPMGDSNSSRTLVAPDGVAYAYQRVGLSWTLYLLEGMR